MHERQTDSQSLTPVRDPPPTSMMASLILAQKLSDVPRKALTTEYFYFHPLNRIRLLSKKLVFLDSAGKRFRNLHSMPKRIRDKRKKGKSLPCWWQIHHKLKN